MASYEEAKAARDGAWDLIQGYEATVLVARPIQISEGNWGIEIEIACPLDPKYGIEYFYNDVEIKVIDRGVIPRSVRRKAELDALRAPLGPTG